MKSIVKILMAIAVLLLSVNSYAQIKNATTEVVKIDGNCGMCKATIEKAGNLNKIAAVTWDKGSKQATLNFDSKKTSRAEILKRIALAGYDSEEFLAPDDVYAALPECCQYDRSLKPVGAAQSGHTGEKAEHSKATEPTDTAVLANVFSTYFSVKDALVKSDAASSAAGGAELVAALKDVDMSNLSSSEHEVWMSSYERLIENAQHIVSANAVDKQREVFAALSTDIYRLAKVSTLAQPLYYQHCPMYSGGKGASWLSKEEGILNPYYGKSMLECGSLQEKINN